MVPIQPDAFGRSPRHQALEALPYRTAASGLDGCPDPEGKDESHLAKVRVYSVLGIYSPALQWLLFARLEGHVCSVSLVCRECTPIPLQSCAPFS